MSRPPLPWGTVLAVAAMGVLLLAYFHARAGGSVGVIAALLIAGGLGAGAVAVSRVGAGSLRRQAGRRTPSVPPRAGRSAPA
ncbi:MAG TPA: hypothetical protein VFX49_23315, partial [Chloroflexota bacterium]|nr:hypothetical protein [Chloroflexota bacterium]